STNGYILVPAPADLRRSLDMTQEAFAAFLRVLTGTVRNWEQGRTPPDPAARTLLALVAADPAHAVAMLGKPTSSPLEGRRCVFRRSRPGIPGSSALLVQRRRARRFA
ncbi:hypothetical protein ABC766_32400, partial (plasmid) [Methylobacterium fujisawaense]